jgi:hypothetical protein
LGSVLQSQNGKNGGVEVRRSRSASDVSLVEMGRADVVRVTREIKVIRERG